MTNRAFTPFCGFFVVVVCVVLLCFILNENFQSLSRHGTHNFYLKPDERLPLATQRVFVPRYKYDRSRINTYGRPYETEIQNLFEKAVSNLHWLKMTLSDAKGFVRSTSEETIEPLKILLLSICYGNAAAFGRYEYCSLTQRRLHDYALRHKYTAKFFDKKIDLTYHGKWQKVFAIAQLLESQLTAAASHNVYDWLAYFDSDIYITNMAIKLESFVQLSDDYAANKTLSQNFDIILSRDLISNDPARFINTGVLLVRVTPNSLEILNRVIEYSQIYSEFLENHFHEQSVFTIALYKHYARNVLIVPLCLLQSFYENWTPGDFLLHLPGLKLQERRDIFRNISHSWGFLGLRESFQQTQCIPDDDMFSFS